MAKSAFDSSDSEGVVSYCNRILEIDPDNCDAWIMRAKSAGWGATLSKVKIPQAITAAKRAINLAPDSKKYEVAEDIYFTIKSQIMQLLMIARNMPAGDSGYLYIHQMMLEWQSALQEIPYLSKTSYGERDIRMQVYHHKGDFKTTSFE